MSYNYENLQLINDLFEKKMSSKPKDIWRLFNKKTSNPARSIDLADYLLSLQDNLVTENDCVL
jgi:hypothetical protein